MTLKQIVEALVFASPKALSTKEIVSALKSAGNPEKTDDAVALALAKTKEDEVLAVLAEIENDLQATGRAFRLMEQVNGWSFVTDPSAVHWVRQLYPEAKPTRLTGPQLETLAIIAYRQPVTRADIEAVRGVAVDGVVQVLMERSLIKIAGRADVPGRPLLYETTEYFLQHFGLKTVNELPNATELRRVELPKADHGAIEEQKEKTKKPKKGEEEAKAEDNTNAASVEEAMPTSAPEQSAEEPAEGASESAAAPESESVSEPEAAVEPEPEIADEPPPEPVVETSAEPDDSTHVPADESAPTHEPSSEHPQS